MPGSLAHGRGTRKAPAFLLGFVTYEVFFELGEEIPAGKFAAEFELDATGERAALPIKDPAFWNARQLRLKLVLGTLVMGVVTPAELAFLQRKVAVRAGLAEDVGRLSEVRSALLLGLVK